MNLGECLSTKDVAEKLGLKADKFRRIMREANCGSSMTWQGRAIWTPDDVAKAEKIVKWVQDRVCPRCGYPGESETPTEVPA